MKKGERGIRSNHRIDPEYVEKFTCIHRQAFTALSMWMAVEVMNKRGSDYDEIAEIVRIDAGYCLDR